MYVWTNEHNNKQEKGKMAPRRSISHCDMIHWLPIAVNHYNLRISVYRHV